LIDTLTADPALLDYHLLPAVRGDLLVRLGNDAAARVDSHGPASLTRNVAERAFLNRRADDIAATAPPGTTLGEAAAQFLRRDDLDPTTIRSYGQTLRRLCLTLGPQLSLESLTADQVARVFAAAWSGAAAKTWNRHRSAYGHSAPGQCVPDLAAGPRSAARDQFPADDDRSTGSSTSCGNRADLPLRERTLWRLLHESAAGAAVVLSLNVENLYLENLRAQTTTAGGLA